MRTHKHKCEDCATIWEHEGPTDKTSAREYVKRHACPKCGAEQYDIFRTKEERQKEVFDLLSLVFR